MPYFLGVDLGTTYTAAAIHRDGRTWTVDLGTRTAAIPSVVFLRDDETILTGEAASRRGATDPARVAREFKRRVGDTTPILLGGAPYSADALMSKLLRWVVDTVTEREGEAPAGIAVAFPANWGPYKQELLGQSIARADLDKVVTITEPEAAVTYYASQERVEPGSVIAVYDLGGGTFDAAVVRKTVDGVELLGWPEGIERLGGVDFDEAVFAHVAASLGGALGELDPDDPAAMAAVQRLRSECVEAKEALSADTEAAIPVLLPNVSTEVRLTRSELEAMIRPPLADSLTAMRRALRSAGVEPGALTAVLLAGGSSRIPLVSQLISAELGRPVAVDAHPKHGVALGAAQAAAAAGGEVRAVPPPPPEPTAAMAPIEEQTTSTEGAAAAAGLGAAAGAAAGVVAGAAAASAVDGAPTVPVGDGAGVSPASAPPGDPPALARLEQLDGGPPPARTPPPPPSGPSTFTPASSSRRRSRVGVIIAALVVLAGIAAVAIVALTREDDDGGQAEGAGTTVSQPASAGSTAPAEGTSAPPPSAQSPATTQPAEQTTAPTEVAAPPVCPSDSDKLCIEMTNIEIDGDSLVIDWTPFNFEPAVNGSHAHFYWNTTSSPEAGTNAAAFGAVPGLWELTDQRPFVSEDVMLLSARPPGATEVCVTPADAQHGVVDPFVFHCLPVPDA